MSLGAGISVANLYYIQPLLATIASGFHTSAQAAGSIATVTQVGYALGLLLVVPLGDALEKRRLMLVVLGLAAGWLLATALAPGLPWMYAASLALGVTTITPQLIVPFAAQLAPADQRGRVVGTVMSGLFVGVLLACTFSGFIASQLGWRAVYLLAALLSLTLLLAFRVLLPCSQPLHRNLSYAELLQSLLRLLRQEPVLRTSSFFGAMSFASFSAFWTVLPFLLAAPPYRFGPGVVGLFALIGVTGIVVAPISGRLADRGRSRLTIGCGLAAILGGFVLMAFTASHLSALIAGLILLDLGATANHIRTRRESIRCSLKHAIAGAGSGHQCVSGRESHSFGEHFAVLQHWQPARQ